MHFKDIPYWADELRALQNEHGLKERYLVRFDPTDVRVLHIFDGTHNVSTSLIMNSRPLQPISLRQLVSARAESKEEGASFT